jgi:hypothetical protein
MARSSARTSNANANAKATKRQPKSKPKPQTRKRTKRTKDVYDEEEDRENVYYDDDDEDKPPSESSLLDTDTRSPRSSSLLNASNIMTALGALILASYAKQGIERGYKHGARAADDRLRQVLRRMYANQGSDSVSL